jgi:hypothetical protein
MRHRHGPPALRPHPILGAAAVGIALASGNAHADGVNGTIGYQANNRAVVVTPRHAYLVSGPDEVSGRPIRRLVLSVADVGSKIRTCDAMSCADGGIGEGMTIDFDAGPRLNYWLVADDQRVQYSGTADLASFRASVNTPQKIAGRWDLDARAAGGPYIQLDLDVALTKAVKRAR